ncbi:M3 family peptidase [Ancylomarina euxinus]|uniref:M3 family peptidase n=1 Tax=Ancylomarina euxinus TaxID=2283627 RepID=A0A425Y2J3_9BACT|nr:M3 family metallopeptidase [Ancylomarina euxinus]MCZ4695010.1 M3 family metallopeptidase [Ancylomarina euxinus]MUP14875.1 M3 family peptidase [Ancylomarina euxinus]RRG22219.1 M3 family peptidase [Ancylomarina euxinus]
MTKNINPLLCKFSTVHHTAPFSEIKMEHYMPAFLEGIKIAREEVDQIANNTEAASFENTIEAMDFVGELLDQVSSVFFNLNHADTSDEMQALAREVSPLLSEFSNDIVMNEPLFARVKAVYNNKEALGLNEEQSMLLDKRYKSFIRSGANLVGEKKARIREISKELSQLTLQFGENVLAATNNFELNITDEKELAGLPEGVMEAAASTAKSKDKQGWVFTLQFPSYVPFMQYADNRELREKMFKVYSSRCFNDKFDNQEIIKKIVDLRLEKVQLFDYPNYAQFVLEERMAENPDKVIGFLNELLEASMPKAKEEFDELQVYAKSIGADFKLQRWDWAYYAEKLKTEKYQVNDELTRPYFELERVKQGIFDLATDLYGLTFKLNTEIDKYHEEVDVYEVLDKKGDFLSVFYADFHPRDSKQGGAWMTSYSEQFLQNGQDHRPHISIVCNFTRPTETKPSLLSFGEVTTFLHEFGHALHGMLSRCSYPSLSGTSVYRDFVELPSQFMENYAFEKQWLDKVAEHYKTGEKIPADLVQKIIDSGNFHSGYAFVRQISFGLNDMAWHSIEKSIDGTVSEFEAEAMQATELFPRLETSCMSPAFSHIFAGGYAAGYYGYKWAEVLDADAFAAFQEKGIYNADIADSFRMNVLERGGSEHPMILYKRFRGQEPSIAPLLKRSGLN